MGIAKLAAYLRAQTEAGVLAVDDCDVAAAQFLDSCQSTLFKPVLFNFSRRAAARCHRACRRHGGTHLPARLPGKRALGLP